MSSHRLAAWGRAAQPAAIAMVLLLVWEAAVWLLDVPVLILPPPSAVFADIWTHRVLFAAFTQPTLIEVLLGFAVAGVLGILLGVLVSFTAFARRTILSAARVLADDPQGRDRPDLRHLVRQRPAIEGIDRLPDRVLSHHDLDHGRTGGDRAGHGDDVSLDGGGTDQDLRPSSVFRQRCPTSSPASRWA